MFEVGKKYQRVGYGITYKCMAIHDMWGWMFDPDSNEIRTFIWVKSSWREIKPKIKLYGYQVQPDPHLNIINSYVHDTPDRRARVMRYWHNIGKILGTFETEVELEPYKGGGTQSRTFQVR